MSEARLIAETLLTRKVRTLEDALRLMSESRRPVLLRGETVQGVLLDLEVYYELLERLQDVEDLQAMREAEAEYRAGDGRPFSDILAEVEREEKAMCQVEVIHALRTTEYAKG